MPPKADNGCLGTSEPLAEAAALLLVLTFGLYRLHIQECFYLVKNQEAVISWSNQLCCTTVGQPQCRHQQKHKDPYDDKQGPQSVL